MSLCLVSTCPINRATTDPPLWANPLKRIFPVFSPTNRKRLYQNYTKRIFTVLITKKTKIFLRIIEFLSRTWVHSEDAVRSLQLIDASTWTKCGILLYVNQVWQMHFSTYHTLYMVLIALHETDVWVYMAKKEIKRWICMTDCKIAKWKKWE